MQALDKCNLLYVVQSQADRTNHIYKIGVSKGVGRLHEHVKHHGGPGSTKAAPQMGRCVGVLVGIPISETDRAANQQFSGFQGSGEPALLDPY
jgi:hypothetical protein